jgi:4-hydroxythreonine-4-phosphate dehydrogenase
MEQRQSDDPNETRTPASANPKSVERPDNNQSASAKQSAEQPANGQPGNEQRRREASQRHTQQRDNRQPNNRSTNQRDEHQQNNRPEREPKDAQGSDNGTNQRNERNAPRNDRDRNQGQRDRQQTTERETNSPEPANRQQQSLESTARVDRDNTNVRDAGSPERLVIGISLGDYNGIGPEVILKALQYNRLQKICTPVIYGSMRVLNRYRNLLNLKDWNLNGAPTIAQISHKMTNVITCWPDQNQDIQPGHVTAEAGQAAFACLQRAVDDLKAGKLDALVTAPINKYNIQSEEFKFPGHTEYLAQEFGVQDNLMFMVSEQLRVGVVTGHVPLGRVRQNVTRDRIAQKLTLMMQSLRQDFGIDKPKIAVLGLNPHAGEEGLLGNEEQEIIKPLIADWRNKGQLVFGPYPADGFFGTRAYTKFDAVLAMYHDQGLIPFKSIAFEEGVNFTAGMASVRTSPDHGTAYDIAGKNLADETSMLQAIYTAVDVARHRKEFLELEANSLKKQSIDIK